MGKKKKEHMFSGTTSAAWKEFPCSETLIWPPHLVFFFFLKNQMICREQEQQKAERKVWRTLREVIWSLNASDIDC